LHSSKWSDGKKKKGGISFTPPHQNNLIQDSEGNEENGCSVLDSNKTEINDSKEPNYVHKNNLKEEILQVIMKNFMEMILDTVNQNMIGTQEILRHQK
jgi:hypothetical protein